MYIHFVNAHSLFASLQLGWAATTGRLLGPTTCLPREDGGIPLSALIKDTASKLASLFSTLSLFYAERQAGKLRIPFFKVFWYDSNREINPRLTECKADALTTTPSRRLPYGLIVILFWRRKQFNSRFGSLYPV